MLNLPEQLQLMALRARAEEWFTLAIACGVVGALFSIVIAAGWGGQHTRNLAAALAAVDTLIILAALWRWWGCATRIRDLEKFR